MYLYGAPLWGCYASSKESEVNRSHRTWLAGFPREAQGIRVLTWLPGAGLDDVAISRCVGYLSNCSHYPWLARAALEQLVLNFRNPMFAARETWYGTVRSIVRMVWPRFDVKIGATLWLTGCPLSSKDGKPGVIFLEAWMTLRRLHHYQNLLTNPPRLCQEDYFAHQCLTLLSTAPGSTGFGEALCPVFPTARRSHYQALVKFFSGRADFARRHAHYMRRPSCPNLNQQPYKTCCLQCLWLDGTITLDSEWHFALGCPHAPRAQRVRELLGAASLTDPGAADLARVFVAVRQDPGRLGEVARELWWSLKEREAALSKLPLGHMDVYITELAVVDRVGTGLPRPCELDAGALDVLKWLLHALCVVRLRFTRTRAACARVTYANLLTRLYTERRALKHAGRLLERALLAAIKDLDSSHVAEAFAALRLHRARPWRAADESPIERPWPGRQRPPWRDGLALTFRSWLSWTGV